MSGLAAALRVLLPSDQDTLLLRACLHSGESGRNAWTQWTRLAPHPRQPFEDEYRGLKGLLPLLQEALQRNGIEADKAFQAYVKAARLREDLRSRIVRPIMGEVFDTLARHDIRAIALKGCAIMDSHYPDPAVRHCHAVNVLVDDDAVGRVADLVAPLGFVPDRAGPMAGQGPVVFRHRTGFPLEVYPRLFRIPYYQAPVAEVWSRSRPVEIAGGPVRVLAPDDNLIHICANAASDRSRANLRWACDAWHVLQGSDAVDWARFGATVAQSRLGLPMAGIMTYLAERLDAPVPDATLAALAEQAADSDGLAGQAALMGALTGVQAAYQALVREAPDAASRAAILRYILLPSPAVIRWSHPRSHPLWLPLLYAARPLRYLVSRLLWRLRARAGDDLDAQAAPRKTQTASV